MSTDFPGFPSPGAGTEAPLEMLASCHIRIEKQCQTLERLAAHLPQHGADEPAQRAAASVLRYFDTAAQQHHADEEENLFPALLESMAGSDAVCLREMTAGLTAEHRKLEAQWRRLRVALEQIAAGTPALLPAHDVQAYVGLYKQHLQREDDELLPMAARLLGVAELDEIGRAMRQRRGIPDQP
jgi:hemerythrin-like domain-containing protein